MKILFKLLSLLILIINFNQTSYAKPLPPGSGEGDVPANILILLDSSVSMRRTLGDGIPVISSITIDGNGNRVLTSADKSLGGLYLFNSAGERINFTGTNQSGRSYTRDTWWAGSSTDQRCDYRLRDGTPTTNHSISTTRKYHEARYVTGVTVPGTNISNENLLFAVQFDDRSSSVAVIALDTQYRCRLALTVNSVKHIRGMDISTNAAGHIIVGVFGRSGRKNAFQMTCNLNQADCEQVTDRGKGKTNVWGRIYDGNRYRLNSDSTRMYISDDGHIHEYATRNVGGQNVITYASGSKVFCQGSGTSINQITQFELSSNDDDILFVGGSGREVVRVQWTGRNNCTRITGLGTASSLSNAGQAAGNLAADSVRVTNALTAISKSGGRILFSHNSYVDELTEANFTSANRNTAWQIQYGGPKITRLDGAKAAIIAVLTDSTLTSGANFGFGHWNAGEGSQGKTGRRGGKYCFKSSNSCSYYGGWSGNHPAGRSRICTGNSCLNVGIGPEGAGNAIPVVERLGVEWGTDSEAFSQIAHDYFFGPVSPHDPNSDCQLNYVIVIGDGEMSGTGTASTNFQGRTAGRLTRMREELGIKTLMVAYGDGIKASGMNRFNELALVGSCDAAGGEDCEQTIVATTPLELQTELQQKIRQILAERLAFTAPSITATIQQGGSLYQAQFAYEQFGEWKGTILRKTLNADGTVEHDPNAPGNWDAAVRVRTQAAGGPIDPGTADSRNIWTPIADESLDYLGNWDNVNEATAPTLEPEMERLGYVLRNYHSSTSNCGGDDTTDDERDGILRFLAGQDFFDYDGDCDTTELRSHVLGDIYHSQLIEIGAPDGNTQFTDNNQEAYFRTINNYQAFKSSQSNRRNILYAGSNSGLLHAFSAETGNEEWAFLPPFLIGKLPTLINSRLDGAIDGFKGGSNAVFGVDGSPVVHDVFMKGLTPEGDVEGSASWHTILFQPFGRGGSGFSVLDVTTPLVRDGLGPMHMFSVYNDYINNVVYIMDNEGEVRELEYFSSSAEISASDEALKAQSNFNEAITADEAIDSETTTNQDAIAVCQSDADVTGEFKTAGTASCYIGRTFTFSDISFNTPNNQSIPQNMINVSEMVDGEFLPVEFSDARMIDGQFVITFDEDKIYNPGGSVNETRETTNIFVQTSCTSSSGIDPFFDYSKLGETWSTPRIVRLPSDIEAEREDPANDKYVAIMGAGMANNNLCAGSALFMVELDNMDEPGKLYGGDQNGGPITIVDTSPAGVALGNDIIETPNGSDINNAVPTSPLVITPDTGFGIPWRGAMVYINDREGKITKINLTDSTKNDAKLFDQTTLFRLNASTTNKRYTFFSMDAGVGVTTKDFWLFGGTGDFNKLGDINRNMDNILYGIRDFDYPYFKHLNGVTIPSFNDQAFTSTAHHRS